MNTDKEESLKGSHRVRLESGASIIGLPMSGVPVVVSDPSRYVVHKLVVASRRHTDGQEAANRQKDFAKLAPL